MTKLQNIHDRDRREGGERRRAARWEDPLDGAPDENKKDDLRVIKSVPRLLYEGGPWQLRVS